MCSLIQSFLPTYIILFHTYINFTIPIHKKHSNIMGYDEKKEKNTKNFKFFGYKTFIKPFYLLSITLLSLLLPLSFLLIARLSSAQYLISLATITPPNTFLYTIFLHANPNLLHALLLLFSFASLVHTLIGKISLITEFRGPIFRPRVHIAWIFLCTLQVCVGLGIEATIKVSVDGLDGPEFSDGSPMLSKLVFLLGLHETMVYWARTIVRPVVDDTVFGGPREERWVEKWALVGCYGAVWWWRLRDEIESLVVLVEVKRDMMMNVGFGDFIGLWLYYLTVVIGLCRILKALIWIFVKLFSKKIVVGGDHQIVDNV